MAFAAFPMQIGGHRPSLASKQPLNHPRLELMWWGPPPAPPPPRASAAPTHLASFAGSGTFSTESGYWYRRYATGTAGTIRCQRMPMSTNRTAKSTEKRGLGELEEYWYEIQYIRTHEA